MSCECLVWLSWLRDYLDGKDIQLLHSPVEEIHGGKAGNKEFVDVLLKPAPLQRNYEEHATS